MRILLVRWKIKDIDDYLKEFTLQILSTHFIIIHTTNESTYIVVIVYVYITKFICANKYTAHQLTKQTTIVDVFGSFFFWMNEKEHLKGRIIDLLLLLLFLVSTFFFWIKGYIKLRKCTFEPKIIKYKPNY